MTVTREQLVDLFTKIGEANSEWYINAIQLYQKSQRGDLITSEKLDWQKIQTRNYIDFADTPEAERKIAFLETYLRADFDLQVEFHTKAVQLFTGGQFAVIAVRLNSAKVLELGMNFFIDYLSRSHDYNLVTELKLIYSSAKLLLLNPDIFLQEKLLTVTDEWSYSLIQGYLNQDQDEKLRSGYKSIYDLKFGYIKE